MKFIILLMMVSCASVPDKVLTQIREEKLAGYWATKTWEGRTNFLKITCDGEIRFDYKNKDKIFNDDKDEGKIQRIRNNELTYKSWTSITRGMKYQKPVVKKDGCFEFRINDWTFTGDPADCSKPKETLEETFTEALKNKPAKCY